MYIMMSKDSVSFKEMCWRFQGNNKKYERLFTEVHHRGDIQLYAQFHHYFNGPSLQAICCDFAPTWDHQTRALKKDSSGWHSIHTTAFCLEDRNIDIKSYVYACTPHVLNEVCESESRVSVFFRVARLYQDVRHLPLDPISPLTALAPFDKRLSRTFHLSSLTIHWLAAARPRDTGYGNCLWQPVTMERKNASSTNDTKPAGTFAWTWDDRTWQEDSRRTSQNAGVQESIVMDFRNIGIFHCAPCPRTRCWKKHLLEPLQGLGIVKRSIPRLHRTNTLRGASGFIHPNRIVW